MLFIAFRTQEDHPRVYKRIVPLCVAAPLLWLPGNSQQPPSTIDRLGTNHDANERRGCGWHQIINWSHKHKKQAVITLHYDLEYTGLQEGCLKWKAIEHPTPFDALPSTPYNLQVYQMPWNPSKNPLGSPHLIHLDHHHLFSQPQAHNSSLGALTGAVNLMNPGNRWRWYCFSPYCHTWWQRWATGWASASRRFVTGERSKGILWYYMILILYDMTYEYIPMMLWLRTIIE